MKPNKRLISLCLSLLLVFMVVSIPAYAAEKIDLNRSCSLTVSAVYDKNPIPDMGFDAYLIAAVDEYGGLTVQEDFQDYEASLNIRGADDASWQELAQTLEREILLDSGLKPSGSAATNQDGIAEFSEIPMGLYLVLGSTVEQDEYVYTTLPFFVLLPEQDLDTNSWSYAVTASAKPAQEPAQADYKVIKIWKDDCHKESRPKTIRISLMCDGEVYDTITLPHEGEWSYTWEDLDVNHHWTVKEETVNGYKPGQIKQDGHTFTVTNICNKPTTPASSGTLPQTGQLWWPVLVLIALGLLCLVLGLIRRRSANHGK